MLVTFSDVSVLVQFTSNQQLKSWQQKIRECRYLTPLDLEANIIESQFSPQHSKPRAMTQFFSDNEFKDVHEKAVHASIRNSMKPLTKRNLDENQLLISQRLMVT